MSSITISLAQRDALNNWARTQPGLRGVFGYTNSDGLLGGDGPPSTGLGDILATANSDTVYPEISRLTLDQDRVLTTGSIEVKYIYISNSTDNPVEVAFLDNDNIPFLNMNAPARGSGEYSGLWVADNGFKIAGVDDIDVVVSILHLLST